MVSKKQATCGDCKYILTSHTKSMGASRVILCSKHAATDDLIAALKLAVSALSHDPDQNQYQITLQAARAALAAAGVK
jgi:hypothetical protein